MCDQLKTRVIHYLFSHDLNCIFCCFMPYQMSSSSSASTNFTVTEGNLTGSGAYLGMLSVTAIIGNVVVFSLGIVTCFINASMVHIFNKQQVCIILLYVSLMCIFYNSIRQNDYFCAQLTHVIFLTHTFLFFQIVPKIMKIMFIFIFKAQNQLYTAQYGIGTHANKKSNYC